MIVNPDRAVLAEYRLKQDEFELERQKLRRLRTKRADTLDGSHVELLANIELPEDIDAGARRRRDRHRPVPLRVPVPQPRRACRPRTSSSRRIREVADGMKGMPVTIRTFDLGADKQQGRTSTG